MSAAARPKLGHVSIQDVPLVLIWPSPKNNRLYRPVADTDPEIMALAESIRRDGLLEPLVITTDRCILSGHRRYAACKLAGLASVPCRVKDIASSDPRFLVLLREYNRQRVKGLDEVVREEVLSADPEEAYRLLVAHRRQRAVVNADTIAIEGHKHRARITAAKAPFLDAIQTVLDARREFWPLTDRQIHYALLNDPPLIHAGKPGSRYQNTTASYKALCELLTRARLAGRIPFSAIHDPTRPVEVWNVYPQPAPYLREQLAEFLQGYYRDLQQSQANQIEIVGEKNTIERIVSPVAAEYCIPLTIGRGYSSLPPRHALAALPDARAARAARPKVGASTPPG
jgi:hypothetical protein